MYIYVIWFMMYILGVMIAMSSLFAGCVELCNWDWMLMHYLFDFSLPSDAATYCDTVIFWRGFVALT